MSWCVVVSVDGLEVDVGHGGGDAWVFIREHGSTYLESSTEGVGDGFVDEESRS